MKKVTQQTTDYFNSNGLNGKAKVGNTEVEFMAYYPAAPANKYDLIVYSLFGNVIAVKDRKNGDVWITNAGWNTVTTKERLNGIDGVSINQVKGIWYLNGKQWGGEWTKVS